MFLASVGCLACFSLLSLWRCCTWRLRVPDEFLSVLWGAAAAGCCWSIGEKVFFCKYNDPIYVKMEKLETIIRLVNDRNIDQVCYLP